MKKSGYWKQLVIFTLGWAFTFLLASPGSSEEDQDFTATGKNRAMIQVERFPLAERLNLDYLLATLVKKGDYCRVPLESQYLYQEIDPIPLESYKIYTPWLNYFKQAMVFVIGRLDPTRLKISHWSVSLHDTLGKEIRVFAGVGNPPTAFYWNGRDRDYRPVAIGEGYIPEITLVDYYNAKVSLPQKMFYLDRFIWEEPHGLIVGFMQTEVFKPKQISFSPDGRMMLQEISNLISLNNAWILEIQCSGPDLDLVRSRAYAMKNYFSRENLRLRKITIQVISQPGEAIVTLIATRPKKVKSL